MTLNERTMYYKTLIKNRKHTVFNFSSYLYSIVSLDILSFLPQRLHPFARGVCKKTLWAFIAKPTGKRHKAEAKKYPDH